MDISNLGRTLSGIRLRRLFNRVIDAVFAIVLLLITLGIVTGVVQLFFKLMLLLLHPTTADRYQAMITDILTLFIMIELSRSLVEYFNTRRLRLTFIADAAIVFVLREIMISMFEHRLPITNIYAYSALLFVLAVLRTSAVLVYQQERRLQAQLGDTPAADDDGGAAGESPVGRRVARTAALTDE